MTKKFHVVFLHSAEQDLKELKAYIVKNSGKDVWQARYRKIKETVNNPASFPSSGKIPDELQSLNITQFRQIISGKNKMIVTIQKN